MARSLLSTVTDRRRSRGQIIDMSSLLLVINICLAEVLTMVGAWTFPALLPTFISDWNLTNTEAGWVAGIYFGGYAVSVPILVSLTDRIDARRVHMGGSALAAVSLGAFAFLAEGFWSALILRTFSGVGLAATYMPGLRMLVDRYKGEKRTRAVAFYTASFSLGTAISFFASGEIGEAFGWKIAVIVAAICAVAAILLVAITLRPLTPRNPDEQTALLDFRPIFRNRAAMGYILAYGVHSWELFAFRTWLVAFLTFSLALQTEPTGWPVPTIIATLSAVVAVFSSIAGNELADKFGRRRMIYIFLVSGGIWGLFVGFLPASPYWVVVILMLLYSGFIQLDSAALTAGTVTMAEEGRRGSTLGLHALSGFGGGAVGPLVVGLVLDAGGGGGDIQAWGLGFASMGLVALLGPLGLWWFQPKEQSNI